MPPKNRFAELLPEITAWRRDFHEHPELLFDVQRTAAKVAELLRSFGCDEVVEGIGRTGVVGVIKGKTDTSGRVIGLRADMDALPIIEATGVPYASKTPGKMHACGHDGHTAMLLGAAKYLAETRNFDGTTVVIFQPAEEGGGGGREMVQDGMITRWGIDEVYGMHNMPGIPVGHFAIRPGAMMATINPTYTAPEVQHQLADSGATMLITIPAFLPVAEAAIQATGVHEIVVIGGAPSHRALDDLMGDALAAQVPVDLDAHVQVLPYSSGTTGRPKGVMLSHRNMVVNVDQTLALLDLQPGETSIAFLPFFHIYGMNVLMNSFLGIGAALVTLPRFDLEAVLRHIQTHRVRRLLIAPPVAIALAKHPMIDQFDLSSLKIVLSAAAPLGAEVAEAVANRIGCSVIQGYGMTELSPITHAVPHRSPRPGAVGVTAPNTVTRIVDPVTGQDCATDQEGEVWVRGPQVMIGYHQRPDATAAMIEDGWLKTGDLGAVDADGYLFIRDRLKELIKVKGFQVAPAEVEAELLGIPGVADAAVIGVPDDEAGEVPMAFIVRAPGSEITEANILTGLTGRLVSYKLPQKFAFIDAVPKSASGKILRRLLRDRLAAGS